MDFFCVLQSKTPHTHTRTYFVIILLYFWELWTFEIYDPNTRVVPHFWKCGGTCPCCPLLLCPWIKWLIDLELPYTRLPQGDFARVYFSKSLFESYKMSHVGTLAVGAFRILGVEREEIMQKSLKIGNNF